MSIDTLFLSLIIFLLLVILLREHARTAGTPRAPTLEGALDALVGSGVLPGGVVEILRYMALRRRRGQVPRLDDNPPRGYPVLGGNLHLVARKRGDPAMGENGHKEPDGEPPGPVPDTTGGHAAPEEGAPRRRQKGDARTLQEAVEPRREHEGEARPR